MSHVDGDVGVLRDDVLTFLVDQDELVVQRVPLLRLNSVIEFGRVVAQHLIGVRVHVHARQRHFFIIGIVSDVAQLLVRLDLPQRGVAGSVLPQPRRVLVPGSPVLDALRVVRRHVLDGLARLGAVSLQRRARLEDAG